ncbi:hypothetical protein HA402_013708 [Bradysia odoriphaga]|nr:hypothetical protein HA402_013708 [Bradysia odoriphaga]
MGVPANDPFFKDFGVNCLNYIRKANGRNCQTKSSAMNAATSWLDLSQVYKTDVTKMNMMRVNSGGKFQMDAHNDLPLTGIIYSLFYRNHNDIAENLSVAKPSLTDEELFQLARKINIGMYQNIVMSELLPALIGNEMSDQINAGKGYNPNINPSTSTEFGFGIGPAIYRLIPSKVKIVNENLEVTSTISITDLIGKRKAAPFSDSNFIRSLLTNPIRRGPVGLAEEFRNKYYHRSSGGAEVGADVEANAIYSGRDVGLRPYIDYLSQQVFVFNDLAILHSAETLSMLQAVYEDVRDIDLQTALLVEPQDSTNMLGELNRKLLADAYRPVVYGDRLNWAYGETDGTFPKEQIPEIRKARLAKFLCSTRGFLLVPAGNIFITSKIGDFVDCRNFSEINFQVFV